MARSLNRRLHQIGLITTPWIDLCTNIDLGSNVRVIPFYDTQNSVSALQNLDPLGQYSASHGVGDGLRSEQAEDSKHARTEVKPALFKSEKRPRWEREQPEATVTEQL